MIQILHMIVSVKVSVKVIYSLVIYTNNLATTLQHPLIATQLSQANTGHDVRHIALIPRTYHIILPSAQLSLGQSILILPMQAQQLRDTIKHFIPRLPFFLGYSRHVIFNLNVDVNLNWLIPEGKVPYQRSSFSGSQVLHSMETERREVSNTSSHLSVPLGTKSVSIISSYNYATNLPLNLVGRTEQMLLGLNHSIDLVKVTHHATQIHRANHLCMFCDGIGQLVIVHLHIVLLAVHHHNLAAHVLSNRCRSCIGISWHNDFIFRANANQAQCHLHSSRSTIQARSPIRAHVCRYFVFKLFGLRTSSYPTTQDGL